MKKIIIVFLVSFVVITNLAAQDRFCIVPGTDLKKLLTDVSDKKGNIKNAVVISLSKSDKEPLKDDKWIRVGGEAHILIDAPFTVVRQVLTDFNNLPKVFIRGTHGSLQATEKVVVQKTAGNVTTATYTTLSKIGPIEDRSSYTADVTANASGKDDPAKTFSETVIQTDSNEKVRKVNALWYAQAVTIDGKPYTYLRFADTSELNQKGLAWAVDIGLSTAHTAPLEQVMDAAVAAAKK